MVFRVVFPYTRSLARYARTAVDQLIPRNENVIGGKCWLLAIGRQAGRQASECRTNSRIGISSEYRADHRIY